jgi:hypothetical protein
VVISGRVNSVNSGETRKDVPACSFTIRSLAPKSSQPVLVRVNIYGEYAKRCVSSLRRGVYVIVRGELMSRRKSVGDIVFVDIRCADIVWCDENLAKVLDNLKQSDEE